MAERDDSQDGDVQSHDVPLRNPSVTAYRVDGDAVLHDSERDQVFAITALARELWERCDGNTPLVEMGRAIGGTANAPPPEVMETLRQMASRLRDQGLLFVPSGDISRTGQDGPPDAKNGETLRVVFGAHQVKVRTDAPKLARAVRRVFHGMLGGRRGDDSRPETVDVLAAGRSGEQYYVRGAGGDQTEEHTLDSAIRDLKHTALRRFMEARPDLIWLHAGAATRDDTSVLVAGPWGSGKSTVIAALCRSGWTYLSDNMAPHDPNSGAILPFPTTIAYRESGKEALSREELAGRPKTRVTLEPARIRDAPVQPDAVFLPVFNPGRPAEVERQGAAEAAVSLVERCQNAGRHHGDAVDRLCRLAGQVPAFQLCYNSRSSISGLLTSALRKADARI
ncbi:PqqD family protein [Salinibacter grassmerensis]|uniref:PqqD family protein n=1 Tax=Salinibacter grassmerensis TaxID=3040353 RepID=UPI0021E95F90|nr:PqqD family protein [Salinibacter grassmerensis]